MKFIATIATACPPNFRCNWHEIEVEAANMAEAAKLAEPNKMSHPWSSLAGIKTAARHHHDVMQAKFGDQPVRPARIVPRASSDRLNNDGTITFSFAKSWARKEKKTHTMTGEGWMTLISRCKDWQTARSIVAQVANGDLPNNLPA